MVSQALNIVDRFRTNVIEKLLSCGIHAASKHEILPDQNSHFVTQLIELVGFVNTATPNP